MRIDDEIRDWVYTFIKDTNDAEGLINQIQYNAHKYGRMCFGIGILVGIFITFILIRWLA